MNREFEFLQLRKFVSLHGHTGLYSTSATVVDVFDDVYNVTGSTDDPKLGGRSWKQLLIDNGINNNCYVTNQKPTGSSSHDDFSVGGHVTTNSKGVVPEGNDSFLMPLCYWHNSTKRDRKRFEHTMTKMLRLGGFMQGDTAVTFAARLSSGEDEENRIIFETPDGWDFKRVAPDDAGKILETKKFVAEDSSQETRFLVLKRKALDSKFYIEFTSDDLFA